MPCASACQMTMAHSATVTMTIDTKTRTADLRPTGLPLRYRDEVKFDCAAAGDQARSPLCLVSQLLIGKAFGHVSLKRRHLDKQ